VKLFATTCEMDLSVLFQEAVRGADAAQGDATGESPLRRLLRQSLVGGGTREIRRQQVPQDDQWTVTQGTFRLVPG